MLELDHLYIEQNFDSNHKYTETNCFDKPTDVEINKKKLHF